MFRAQPIAFAVPEPLSAIMADAAPDQLLALAGYFEFQARRLRLEAKLLKDRAQDNAKSQAQYRASKIRFLRVGALVAVLTRRYGGNRTAALSEVRNRTGWSLVQITGALERWKKEKTRRARLKRDLRIYAEDLRGDRQKDIAARHKITARRVRDIVADVQSRLHRSNQTTLFRSAASRVSGVSRSDV